MIIDVFLSISSFFRSPVNNSDIQSLVDRRQNDAFFSGQSSLYLGGHVCPPNPLDIPQNQNVTKFARALIHSHNSNSG